LFFSLSFLPPLSPMRAPCRPLSSHARPSAPVFNRTDTRRRVPHDGSRHARILASRPTTSRTAAASPQRIPRHAWTHVDQAASDALIWGGTLGMRRDAQGTRDGELSVPRRRWPVCAIDYDWRPSNWPRITPSPSLTLLVEKSIVRPFSNREGVRFGPRGCGGSRS
jgi:hypothetical protein